MNKDINYYDYALPERFIAQTPTEPRDACKMLVYDRKADTTEIRRFYDVLDYLKSGDVVIINETRVIPARLFGTKKSGAKIEILLLKKHTINTYSALVRPMKRVKIGDSITVAERLKIELTAKDISAGVAMVRLSVIGGDTVVGNGTVGNNDTVSNNGKLCGGDTANSSDKVCDGNELCGVTTADTKIESVIDEIGLMPLPPYIRDTAHKYNREYNTVYAKINGSSAAPTAGLHWTNELMERAKAKGVIFAPIVLNVGLGTFRPVKVDDITKHKMHGESYHIPPETAEIINSAKAENRRIIATGTTSLRTLEGCFAAHGKVIATTGETDIFIYPPYKFRVVDCLITNFHLPKSTLIMLVSAFLTRDKTMELYETAKQNEFRFFSFGDCMLLI
ncbi:MAG: tRNA preQ1(34) S-adenosylmethionine ribosyltransferase-isomerase QueA [Christensenellaceae bacterium]|jgi:S-adenosylmethionine:tRNA ribosyltransferase-isomerase|nr:tRNA preQ1(34) S-adenosylmethionine ribosyltransferase-isomerase QueA [Christensenellaceae bacterium]